MNSALRTPYWSLSTGLQEDLALSVNAGKGKAVTVTGREGP
jgi:hypothetical protein